MASQQYNKFSRKNPIKERKNSVGCKSLGHSFHQFLVDVTPNRLEKNSEKTIRSKTELILHSMTSSSSGCYKKNMVHPRGNKTQKPS